MTFSITNKKDKAFCFIPEFLYQNREEGNVVICIIEEDIDISSNLEKVKREILAIHRQLVQDRKMNNQLDISFSVVDDAMKDMIEELKKS